MMMVMMMTMMTTMRTIMMMATKTIMGIDDGDNGDDNQNHGRVQVSWTLFLEDGGEADAEEEEAEELFLVVAGYVEGALDTDGLGIQVKKQVKLLTPSEILFCH